MNLSEMLNERYGKEYLSYSSIKQALNDMAWFDMYMKKEIKYESDALRFGTMYDMLLFEPNKAYETYQTITHDHIMSKLSDKAKASKNPKLTSEYKAAKALMETEALESNVTLVSVEDWQMANDMISRLHDTGIIKNFLSGQYQHKIELDIYGVPIKGFLDCLGDGYISDSKSTKSVSGFRWDVNKLSYDIQAYIYTEAMGIKKFYWVVQEKTYPYTPAIVTCSEETLFKGEMKFKDAVSRIRKFLKEEDDFMKDYIEYTV
jgi:hypothetical protein